MGGPGSENKYQRGVLREDKMQRAQHERRMERESGQRESFDAARGIRQQLPDTTRRDEADRAREMRENQALNVQGRQNEMATRGLNPPPEGPKQVASPQYTQPPPAEGLAGGWGGMGPAPIEGQAEASGAGGIRRIVVSPGPLFYPLDKPRSKLPRPSTFSGERALYFVLENQGACAHRALLIVLRPHCRCRARYGLAPVMRHRALLRRHVRRAD